MDSQLLTWETLSYKNQELAKLLLPSFNLQLGRSKQLIPPSLMHSSQEPGGEGKEWFSCVSFLFYKWPNMLKRCTETQRKGTKGNTHVLLLAFENVAAVWRAELERISLLFHHAFKRNCSLSGTILNYWSWKISWVHTGFIRAPVRHSSTIGLRKCGQSPRKHLQTAWPAEYSLRTEKNKDTRGSETLPARVQIFKVLCFTSWSAKPFLQYWPVPLDKNTVSHSTIYQRVPNKPV